MNVNRCPIFVSSLDSHSDLWSPFFIMFKRAWPEYEGVIYLNTQELDFSFEGLNIICTKVGSGLPFGAMFLAGLNRMPSEVFLLLMIDYFIEGRIDTDSLQLAYEDLIRCGPDSICLMPHRFERSIPTDGQSRSRRILAPGGWAWFSLQSAFWYRKSLRRFIRPWENPWIAELFGCRRAVSLEPDIWVMESQPIPYHKAGILHGGGKWYREALERLNLSGVLIDFNKREWYNKEVDKAPEWTQLHPCLRSAWMFFVHRGWLAQYVRSEMSLGADWFSRKTIGMRRRMGRRSSRCLMSERIDSRREPIVAVCAILKNERRYIREWIEFHRQIGIEKFYLYDNESTDGLYSFLREYLASGLVEYVYFPGEGRQHAAYKHCISRHAFDADWIAFIDLDEFIIPQGPGLKAILSRVKLHVDQVLMSWMIYGNGGQSEDSDRPVTERFLWRGESPGRTKAFVRPRQILRMKVHEHLVLGETEVASVDLLRVNHYHCKTWTEYSCKMQKGDVSHGGRFAREKYNRLCFDLHNLNQVYDPCAVSITEQISSRLRCVENMCKDVMSGGDVERS